MRNQALHRGVWRLHSSRVLIKFVGVPKHKHVIEKVIKGWLRHEKEVDEAYEWVVGILVSLSAVSVQKCPKDQEDFFSARMRKHGVM